MKPKESTIPGTGPVPGTVFGCRLPLQQFAHWPRILSAPPFIESLPFRGFHQSSKLMFIAFWPPLALFRSFSSAFPIAISPLNLLCRCLPFSNPNWVSWFALCRQVINTSCRCLKKPKRSGGIIETGQRVIKGPSGLYLGYLTEWRMPNGDVIMMAIPHKVAESSEHTMWKDITYDCSILFISI